MDIVKKYAKDLCVGDKISGHEKGWLFVSYVKRIPYTDKTEIVVGGDRITCNSHTIFEDVLVNTR